MLISLQFDPDNWWGKNGNLSYKLFKIRIEANETVIKNIFEYIYSGSCNYELSLNSPIDSLLYWANRIEMP